MVSVAPTGFPCFSDLRKTLEVLQHKYGVLGHADPQEFLKVLNSSTNNWRIMMRDVYTLAKAAESAGQSVSEATVYPDVNELLRQIELPVAMESSESLPNGVPATESQAQSND